MNQKEIVQFITENPVFFLGTCHNRIPHVRAMRILRVDEHGIFFSTSRQKGLFRQLIANPLVELCFYSLVDQLQIRIQGKIVYYNDPDFLRDLADRVPALSSFILDDSPSGVAVFCLREGKVSVWREEDFVLRRLSGVELTSVWMAMCNGRINTPLEEAASQPVQ